jgi:hypothetical protein
MIIFKLSRFLKRFNLKVSDAKKYLQKNWFRVVVDSGEAWKSIKHGGSKNKIKKWYLIIANFFESNSFICVFNNYSHLLFSYFKWNIKIDTNF